MKSKKAQGLSINTIIIAAIAIIVMIIIILVFTGRIKGFNQAAQDCQSVGGRCVEDGPGFGYGVTNQCDGENERVTTHFCEDEDPQDIYKKVCCMGFDI